MIGIIKKKITMKYIIILVSTFMFSQTENKIKFNYLSFGGGIYEQQQYKIKGLTKQKEVFPIKKTVKKRPKNRNAMVLLKSKLRYK